MSSDATGALTQTDFYSKGPTHQFVLRFPAGQADCTFDYPYSERIDHIKRIVLKDYVLVFEENAANELPDTIELITKPSLFKRNSYYPTGPNSQVNYSDAFSIPLVRGFQTPKGNYRFSNTSPRGVIISEVPYGSQRSLPSNITFRLSSSVFVPAVVAPSVPGSFPGGTPIPVAEQSTVILEIETWGHKLEDQKNPLFSVARPYYV